MSDDADDEQDPAATHDDGHDGNASHDEDGSHDDHGHGEDRPDFDPSDPTLPAREPPLRSTAPQSDYSFRMVGIGALVTLLGVAVTFGLGVLLA